MVAAAPLVLAAQLTMSPTVSPTRGRQDPPQRLAACQACHGVDGVATFTPAPNLAGQKAGYLVAQLRAFRDGSRKSDFMSPIAAQLSDRDISELAGHFASLPAIGSLTADARRAGAVATNVKMPADFPHGFREYARSDDVAAGTIARSYVNTATLRAAQARAPLPDGAMIVVETAEAMRDASGSLTRDSAGRLVPGDAQSYAVSAADIGWGAAVPTTLRNGNWHYAQFAKDRQRMTTNQAACLACHRATEHTSFVFGLQAIEAQAIKPSAEK